MVQYSTVQYGTVKYSTVQYSTVQYSIVQEPRGDQPLHLLQVAQHGPAVPLPLLVQVVPPGVLQPGKIFPRGLKIFVACDLAAAELQRYLHVVCEDVVKVLHAAVQRVPVSSVGDPVIEIPPAN